MFCLYTSGHRNGHPFKIYENFTLVCFLKENNHIYAVFNIDYYFLMCLDFKKLKF